jgi:hypothetical protein
MPYLPTRPASVQPSRSQRMNIQRRSIFYGWWVVLASAVGLFWGPPITVFSFSVFLKPLMRDFHAGRAAISLGYTVHAIAGAFSAPLVGCLLIATERTE